MAGANRLYTLCEDVFVGIGVSNPMHKLHVLGTSYSRQFLAGSEDGDQDALYNGYSLNNTQYLMKLGKNIQTVDQSVKFSIDNNGAVVISNSGNTAALTINTGGQKAFEIKDENGDEILQLDNDGLLHSREIRVDALTWPDYVFSKEYELKPLSEVAQFIEAKGHLPNIPSEKEILEKGINVSEMQQLQMEKIEELTLYLIEMDKKVSELENKVSSLELENDQLKLK
jgi:hypothetical protein